MKYQSLRTVILLFFATTSVSFAQIPEENTLILSSGNPYLYDVSLLDFDGKSRLGIQYYEQENKRYSKNDLPDSNYFRSGNISLDLRMNLKMYFKLLEVKFLEEFYNQMQTEEPTAGTGNMSDMFKTAQGGPDQKSRFAQLHLMEVLKVLINEEGFNRYFCAEGNQCKKGLGDNYLIWGGLTSDEFEQHQAFQNFVQETLPDLLKWSRNLDNRFIGVSSLKFSEYDFEKQGFPIQISPKFYLDKIAKTVYVPKLDFELNAITNHGQFTTLLKLPPDAARALREKMDKGQRIYFTLEIEFYGISERTIYNLDDKYLEYHLVSPFVSLYLNPDLSEKIGEIVIE